MSKKLKAKFERDNQLEHFHLTFNTKKATL